MNNLKIDQKVNKKLLTDLYIMDLIIYNQREVNHTETIKLFKIFFNGCLLKNNPVLIYKNKEYFWLDIVKKDTLFIWIEYLLSQNTPYLDSEEFINKTLEYISKELIDYINNPKNHYEIEYLDQGNYGN